jgi:uncharacterized protein YcfJ
MNKSIVSLLAVVTLAGTGAALADDDRGWRGHDNGRHNGWYQGRDMRRGSSDYDYARVVRVEPLTRQVRVSYPQRECRIETVYDRGDDRYYRDGRGSVAATNGAIVGGLIGGAVGNQVGRGDGRRIATVAGALIGAAIGHDVGRQREADRNGRYGDYDDRYYDRGREVERCRVRHEQRFEERIDGYRVTYEYHGREYTTRMNYDPGRQVRVRVDVFPDEGY